MYKSDEAGKIFVGGLNWETTEESLRSYFMKYGDVTDCVIMKQTRPDNSTTSRGFGFVTFKDPEQVKTVINSQPHYLDGKKIDPKPAVPKGPGQQAILQSMQKPSSGNLKVFVGGIAAGTTEHDLKDYFSAYGKVCDVTLMYDKTTSRMRGFGFVGFESQASVDQVIHTKYHQINGKTVEVKPAEPQNKGAMGGMKIQVTGPGVSQGGYGGAQYGPPAAHMYQQQQPQRPPFGQMNYGGYPPQQPQPQAQGPASAPGGYSYSYGMTAAAPGYENGYQQQTAVAASRDPYRDPYGSMTSQAATASPYGEMSYGRAPAPTQPQRESPAAPSYGAGLGSYQQEASQFGPSRSSYPPETGYGTYPDPYAGYPAAAGAGDAANPVPGFGRGGSASTSRGFHPYGR